MTHPFFYRIVEQPQSVHPTRPYPRTNCFSFSTHSYFYFGFFIRRVCMYVCMYIGAYICMCVRTLRRTPIPQPHINMYIKVNNIMTFNLRGISHKYVRPRFSMSIFQRYWISATKQTHPTPSAASLRTSKTPYIARPTRFERDRLIFLYFSSVTDAICICPEE